MNGIISYGNTQRFEQTYASLRHRENRIYSDNTLLNLPEIGAEHPHAGEWVLRKESAGRLKKYLSERNTLRGILEIGCGNGWLSHYLSRVPGTRVSGIDLNFAEISQAKRVFAMDNLEFLYGDIHHPALSARQFDCIIIAAAIPYFPSINTIVTECMDRLRPGGELHILDSPLYNEKTIGPARKRSERYYEDLGFPEMIKHYHHHSTADFLNFNFDILYQPSLVNRLRGHRNPFPWIRIKKKSV